jgi:hypothetical protein
MILVGSQRGGPRQLAAHLLNDRDNDHVALQEIRGFMAPDLNSAMAETVAIAKGTRCRQPVFSLSLNPPKDGQASIDDFMDAVERAETALGLQGQPRAVVIHEKSGRRHAHVVWSRIDPRTMTAVNLPFFKSRLNALSKDLYLDHGWELPEGHRTNGWKNPLNFTLAEWQQAKRLDLDPREIKQIFRDAWVRSDNLASFRSALEQSGYYLAKGDRRGLVATDLHGEVYSLSRWAGISTKELNARLGKDHDLPGVSDVQAGLRQRLTHNLKAVLKEDRDARRGEVKAARDDLRRLVLSQRLERARLKQKQDRRWQAESRERSSRFRRGLGIVLDVLTGRLFALRKQNEAEAYAAFLRDRTQRERLYEAQDKELKPHHQRLAALLERQRSERRVLAERISTVLRLSRERGGEGRQPSKAPDLDYEQ